MGYILGLDLGITSVGFGIIEEDTYKIIKYGVRLFDEGTADNNDKIVHQEDLRVDVKIE